MGVHPGQGIFGGALASRKRFIAFLVSTLLVIGILQPNDVVAAVQDWPTCRASLVVYDSHGIEVGVDDIVPHTEGHEDVRAHVLRVAGIGSDL